jgi:hypothetical protein
MTDERITPFNVFHASVKNKEYQRLLDKEVNSVFGNKKTLSFNDFVEKENIMMNIYQKVSDKDAKQIDAMLSCVFNLDGDITTINREEYKTLLAALDAQETDKNEPLSMDGKFSVNGESSGVYSLESSDIESYYRKLNWQKMGDEELLNEMRANVQKTLQGNMGGTGNNEYKLHDIITTVDIYLSQSNLGKTMTREKALKACVGDDIIQYNQENSSKFPQWASNCAKGSSLFYSKTLGGKPTIIKIDSHSKTCAYSIEVNGKAYEIWRNAGMNWSSAIGYR